MLCWLYDKNGVRLNVNKVRDGFHRRRKVKVRLNLFTGKYKHQNLWPQKKKERRRRSKKCIHTRSLLALPNGHGEEQVVHGSSQAPEKGFYLMCARREKREGRESFRNVLFFRGITVEQEQKNNFNECT